MLFIGLLLVFCNLVCCDERIGLRTVKKDVWEHTSVASCAAHLNKLTWGFDHEHTAYYALICQYPPAFDSWAMCIQDMINMHVSSESEQKLVFEKSLLNVKVLCSYVDKASANITMDEYYFGIENGTKYLPENESEQQDMSEILYRPIKVLDETLKKVGHAYHGFARNLDISNIFGVAICFYFVGLMLLIGFLRYLNFNAFNLTLFRYKFVNKFRGKMIIPTLFKKHADYFTYNRYITGLLPTSYEALMLSGYIILHTVLILISYEFDPFNIIFASKSVQIVRYLGDRTGIMAFAHLPLIILFSTRSNLFMHITGFNYSTFIMFHKWIGRMMVLDAMIHGTAYSIYALLNHTFISSNKLLFWKFGVAALIFSFILFAMSFGFLRKHYYETFLYTHIFLAILFFYSCWKHVEHIGWKDWIVTSLVLWVTERIIRIGRLIRFGFPDAKLKTIGEDVIHVTVPKKDYSWRCEPGEYVFAYFMHPLIFWQSHPFTVMDFEKEVVIIVRAKSGLTKRLYNKIDAAGGNLLMKVSLEGPYGTCAPVHRFNDILMFAGGSGIPGPLIHAIDLANKLPADSKKRIKLIISTRELSFLLAYKKQLMMLEDKPIDTSIYVTKTRAEPVELDDLSVISEDYGSRDSVSIISNTETNLEHSLSTFLTFHKGRPNTSEILQDEMFQSSSLAILACGPPIFVDDIRNLTAQMLINNPDKVIDYYEEYQTW